MFTKQWFVGLVVLLLLGFSSELVADKFAKTFGDSLEHTFTYILQTSDGGYIAGGFGRPPNAEYTDALVVKLDSAGTMEWVRAYGTASEEVGSDAGLTSDGGFIVAGSAVTAIHYNHDVLVMKCNSAGAVQWAKAFSDPACTTWYYSDLGASVQQTSDGGYVVAGFTGSSLDWDIFVLKLNSVGNLAWAKTYDDTVYDGAYRIQQTSDGGYIVAGYRKASLYSDPSAALILKLNSTGDVQWARTFGGISGLGEEFRAVQQTSDGGYIVAGRTFSYGAGSADFLVLKLSSAGDVQWAKTFGGTDYDNCYSIRQTSDDGYIVAGITLSYGAGLYDFLVMKLSSAGDLAWARRCGGSDVDYAQCVQQTSDSGYIVAGYTRSYGAGYNDLLVCKLESDGVYDSCFFDCSPAVTSPSPAASSPSVVVSNWTLVVGLLSLSVLDLSYLVNDVCPPDTGVVVVEGNVGRDIPQSIYLEIIPTVGKNKFSIKYGIPNSVDVSNNPTLSLKLYDVTGRLERVLFEKNIRCWCQAGSYTRSMDLSELQGGVYFLRLEVGNKYSVKKAILLR